MANESLIQFDGGVLVADIITEASATNEIELTQYPIETGGVISDHAIIKPFVLELSLVQTETPLTGAGISGPGAAGFRTQSVDMTYPTRPPGTQSGQADVPQPKTQLTLQGLSGAALQLLGGGPAKQIRWTGLKSDAALSVKQFRVSVLQADQDVARVNEFHDALLALQAGTTLLVVTVKGQTYVDMVLTSVKRTDPQGKAGCATFGVTLQQIKTVETQTVDLPPVPKATAKKSQGKATADPATEAQKRKTFAAAGVDAGLSLLQGGG